MSARHVPVGWNASKIIYDVVALGLIGLYLTCFLTIAPRLQDATRNWDGPSYAMRAYGSCAFLLLTLVLCIGPLARLDRRFLPLLYNRRHLGVMTCAVALMHAQAVIGWYFSYGPDDPYVLLLRANTSYARASGFPFEMLGAFALLVLILLAATSHDFWLAFLRPPVWKALHMAIYAAYAAVIAHLALGALQASTSPFLGMLVLACAGCVVILHLLAACREHATDWSSAPAAPESPWLRAARLDQIAEGRGITVHLDDAEAVAIFRHEGQLVAVTNLCAHQNGPLGEGRIIDGCITCPWHGFQYDFATGCAPPPFTERLASYNLRITGSDVWLDPRPREPGNAAPPVPVA